MSQNQQDTNRLLMYGLGAVVILLLVIVALVFARAQSGTQAVVPSTGTGATATTPGGTSMPGVAPSAGAFDAKTATKVPAGTDPKAFVSKYYQAILDKKWDVAFKMQPAASQANGSVADFQATQTQYGMKSFKVTDSKASGDTAEVTVEQDLGTNGKWGATWSFVKSGADWVVKERKVVMAP